MGIAGAGFGAAKALEEILGEQMLRAQMQAREQEAAERTELERQRLAAQQQQNAAENDFRQQTINLQDRRRRDENNAQGLELMQTDKLQMDQAAILESLPPRLRQIADLRRVGVSGISPEDLRTPDEVKAADEAEIQKQIRIRRGSQQPPQPRERKQAWVVRNGQPTPIEEGTAQPGDRPYDPVAARSSQPQNNAEAIDTAREATRLAAELYKHKGVKGAFGVLDQYLPTINQDTQDAINLRDALTGMLTLENMNKMKGVLSDSDMKLLRQASTTLQPGASDNAARGELKRIAEVMSKLTGDANPLANEQAQTIDPRVKAMIDKYSTKR